MSAPQAEGWTRRRFLGGLTLARTARMRGPTPRPVAAEPPPKTTTLRLLQDPGICFAPEYVAEELLQSEGCTDVRYIKTTGVVAAAKALATGELHFGTQASMLLHTRIDAGAPIVYLAGLHRGCFELFGTDRVRAIHDLKGRRVGVAELGSSRHLPL
jgi:NitT/TauT family transport system substrate-binding protein